jgi:hypothetical protein
MSATPLQHCACGCHTLVRGADYVNDYHEYPYSQGQVWQPYTASLPQRVPPEPRDSVEEQSGSYPSLTVADFGGEGFPKHMPRGWYSLRPDGATRRLLQPTIFPWQRWRASWVRSLDNPSPLAVESSPPWGVTP